MGGQGQSPIGSTGGPIAHQIGLAALRRDAHPEAFQLGIPDHVAVRFGLQSLDYPLSQTLGHHMVTRTEQIGG